MLAANQIYGTQKLNTLRYSNGFNLSRGGQLDTFREQMNYLSKPRARSRSSHPKLEIHKSFQAPSFQAKQGPHDYFFLALLQQRGHWVSPPKVDQSTGGFLSNCRCWRSKKWTLREGPLPYTFSLTSEIFLGIGDPENSSKRRAGSGLIVADADVQHLGVPRPQPGRFGAFRFGVERRELCQGLPR